MRRLSVVLAALALAVTVMLAATIGAASGAVSGTNVLYTTDADFDQGTLVNVNHDAPNNNQLQLNETSGTFPFIWIALSQRCTIAKIDTRTGTILGEYRTISDDRSCNESSRTTVALDGSVWVGHRGPGGVNHVGLVELNQCVDRNSNSTIETSSGYGDVKPWPGSDSNVANAQDECILHHVDTDSLGFGDSRHMSIDPNNKLWIGTLTASQFVRVDGNTGAIDSPVSSMPCGGYGGLIDGNGVIWSAPGTVLRWDPDAPTDASNPRCIGPPNSVYGVAIDPNGWVWVNEFGSRVSKISPDGNTFEGPFNNGSIFGSQGLAVDRNGDAWISSSLSCFGGCTIGHLKNDGTFVGNVSTPTGSGSTGIAVDADGKIWAANRNSNTATRIDPNAGPLGCGGTGCGDGTRVGEVDLTVDFPAGPDGRPLPFPYNYSDMTGAQVITSTPQGTWTVVQDGGSAGTEWGKVTWNTEPQGSEPPGTSITVEARASDSEAGLGSEAYVPVSNGTDFTLTGRFIQVRVTLKPDGDGNSPVLSDIRIQTSGPSEPAKLTLTPESATNKVDDQHCVTAAVEDESGNATPDVTVQFDVSGSNTESGSATTDGNGEAQFCYTAALPGSDTITATAEGGTNPSDTATKTWAAPSSTRRCKITGGGRIEAANGDRATFGGNAHASNGSHAPPHGSETYQDHGPAQDMSVKGRIVKSVVCSADGTAGSIFASGRVDGQGGFQIRIDVKDPGEPGKDDTYRIRVSNGYDSGEQVLEGGNVQIHK